MSVTVRKYRKTNEWEVDIRTSPKGGRLRYVPLTMRLAAAFREHRHLRGPRVLYQDNGRPFTQQAVQTLAQHSARRAGLKNGVHVLRHTFCSHLAMKGAPAKAIQELAAHKDLSTTQHYMHLSPAALDASIRLLDSPGIDPSRGEIVEKGNVETSKSLAIK